MDSQGKAVEAMHRHATAPSPWIERFGGLVPPGSAVLDIAAGNGRHSRYFLALGHPVIAVDRDLTGLAATRHDHLTLLTADLEAAPWPFGNREFGGVVATNYLHRPLLPYIVGAVAEGGALIYETFAEGNEACGRPRNPDFLLKPGELLDAVRGRLSVVAYEHGIIEAPRSAVVQRIVAVRKSSPSPIQAVRPSSARN